MTRRNFFSIILAGRLVLSKGSSAARNKTFAERVHEKRKIRQSEYAQFSASFDNLDFRAQKISDATVYKWTLSSQQLLETLHPKFLS